MNVRDVIDALSKLPPDLPVWVEEDHGWFDVNVVEAMTDYNGAPGVLVRG